MTNISSEFKKKLVEEIRLVAKKIKEEEGNRNKLYFFSAVYGAVNRIFNLEYNTDLVFMHSVLSSAYRDIDARLSAEEHGAKVPPLPEDFFEKLAKFTAELADRIEENKNPYEVLQKIAILAYITTGNGYYLYQQGIDMGI